MARYGEAGMNSRRLHRLRRIVLAALALVAGVASAAPVQPAMQVSGDDFPELIVHLPKSDVDGDPLALACDQIRPRRIDELDPLWKRAVDRIHLDCEQYGEPDAAMDRVATWVTAYLKPGAVVLATLVVSEVRLMDSELWSDHQYVLDGRFDQIGSVLQEHVEARCRMAHDNPDALGQGDCRVTRDAEGVFIDTGMVGGTWIHPDPHDADRTVYAEAWAE